MMAVQTDSLPLILCYQQTIVETTAGLILIGKYCS